MEGTRKKDPPSEVTIRHAKNGGYIVRHSFDNMGKGESYRPSEEHAFTSHKELMAHVHTHTAGPPADAGGKAPSGVGVRSTAKAPGPGSPGAGLD